MSCIAAVQMVSGPNVDDNLKQAAELLKVAAKGDAQMVVLPENFCLLDSPALRPLAEQEEKRGTIRNYLAEQARKHGIWIVAGSVPMASRPDLSTISDGRVRAACLVIDDQGELRARYDKIHLFDVQVPDAHGSYLESSLCEPGDELVVLDTPVGKLGLTICYDLRFPEQFQRLREMGAELISVPSAFTYITGQAHWEALLRARAIETQCYLIGADQGGSHSPTRETWGQTMVVKPDGHIVDQLARGAGVVFSPVDLAAQAALRARMPVLDHRQKAGF